MATLIPYIVFPGTCKEAITFYAQVLKGEITSLQTFKDSHMDIPVELENRIFDAGLRAGNILIKASDDLPSHPVAAISNISLFVGFSDKEERDSVFHKLSEEGTILLPLEDQFGMVKDKFGTQWMIQA